ncbi:SCP2 sterol-binding domain-containing protein [Thalassospira sp.]|uniref:SCP2 sterol-binding domain-containing protein n=1 Tax=Thalassospira sp. TaxID=1912094 RepID=UPI00273303A6|nr:SCP2 sterol-binding domain-containing protein [Thalassospira sp.]MDP2699107.1 SCP2 sterol-binding domain-containing protein [Thalassospira sp.]
MEAILETIRTKLPQLRGLNAVIAFDCGDDGHVVIDATGPQPDITDDPLEDADCILKISQANLAKMLAGKLDPMLAFTMGKVKVKGSMGIAAKLSARLD